MDAANETPTLAETAALIAELYAEASDDQIVSLGTREPFPVEGGPTIYVPAIAFTVAEFRRWSREAIQLAEGRSSKSAHVSATRNIA